MKTARFVLKIVGAALTVAALACLIIGFWDKITGCCCKKAECDDFCDEILFEE